MTNAIEVNCETGEVIERPLTDAEIAQREKDAAEFEARLAAEEAAAAEKAAAKQSAQEKLSALGLSDKEILAITGI